MYELKEYLNSINYQKNNLMDDGDVEWEKKYPAYVVNKCLAPFGDTVMLVNEMNRLHHLDNKMQYTFLLMHLKVVVLDSFFSPILHHSESTTHWLSNFLFIFIFINNYTLGG